MLIRKEQLGQMGEALFVERFRSLLQESFEKARGLSRDELDPVILDQLHRAAGYGLVSEQPAATFVMAAWLLGPGFDTVLPGVRDRLTDSNLSESQKGVWLEAYTAEFLNALEGK